LTQLQNESTTKFIYILAIAGSIILAYTLVVSNLIIALFTAIGLGLAIAIFFNTNLAIYVLIFSMLLSPEFGSRGTMGGGFTIRIDDIILGIVVFTWIAKIAINNEVKSIIKTPLHKPIFYYLIVCIISTGFGVIRGNVNYLSGFFFLFKYFEYFVIFFMVYNQITSKKQIVNFYYSLLLTFIIVVLVASSQIPAGGRLTAPFEGEGGEPNTLGGYLLLIMAVNLSLIFFSNTFNKIWIKRGVLGVTIVAVFPFLLTNSRGSWVAGIPVAISYILLRKSRNITLIFIVLLLILSPFILPDSVVDRVKYTFTEQEGYARGLQEDVGGLTLDTSASERVRSWKSAFKELPNHILLGFGVTGWRFLDAQYMRVLIETGIIGFIVFIFMLYKLMNSVKQIHIKTKDQFYKALSLGFLIGTFGMLTHGIGANTFIIVRIMEPFWLIAGMIFAIPKIENHQLIDNVMNN